VAEIKGKPQETSAIFMERPWLKHYEAGLPANLSYPDIPLHQVLTESARRYPDRPALEFYGRCLTYRELEDLTARFATALIQFGIQKGERVAIMLPNMPQTLIAYFGILKAGACVVQVNPLYVAREVVEQLRDSGAETIVALDQFYARIQEAMPQTMLKRVILTKVRDYLPWLKRVLYPLKAWRQGQALEIKRIPPIYDFRALLKAVRSPSPAPEVSPSDLALLQYTGGTTGAPKGAMLTHRNLVANAMQCRYWLGGLLEGTEVFLGVLPLFHVYGMSTCQNLAILLGAKIVLLPRFQADEVLTAIVTHRVTAFPGIPAMYLALNNHPKVGQYDLRSVRFCISGAGPLFADVQARFEKLTGSYVVEGYGLTEASPVTHCNPIVGQRRSRSIGLPVSDTDARLVDLESGIPVTDPETVGELQIKGPQVMRGYWNNETETAAVFKDGWLCTGDLASMDRDGFFYIQDRKKDMIKSGGMNVYPREVDECLCEHPKVKDACVIGIPEELRGERIKAFVVLKDGERATTNELLEHCRKRLAKFKMPKQIEFRKELPKTVVGKVLRRVLLAEELTRPKGSVDLRATDRDTVS
jgi:long-chain acyl-CoA synthetase